MPIYEYQCEKCGHHLEKLQKISDEPLKECPECKKPALVKLVSAAGFKLKGTGWYETDFKNKSSDKPDNKKKETKSEAKTETKSSDKTKASVED